MADDQRWIAIQQRTFTGWVNQHLKDRILKVNDLITDLSDGLLLINLLEIISSKTLPAHNKKPKIKAQKLENCSWALKFLKEEGIKLVAIGPEDIVDCQKKLILGLIWTIILRYHIQKGGASSSAKNDLLAWVRQQIPECNVIDFTTSWKDGKAICHLTDSLKRGTVDLPKVDENPNALENATLGEDVAQAELEIPKILQPSDMVSDDCDELSVMTYISYFRDYALNSAKRNDRAIKEKTADPTRCVASGPGLEGGEQFVPSQFKIQAKNCFGDNLKEGGDQFEVVISPPSATPASKSAISAGYPPERIEDHGDGTYTAHFTPLDYGKHTINITLKKQPIANNPYSVPIDRSSISVSGSGLESADLFLPASFTILAKKMFEAKAPANPSDFNISVLGPKATIPSQVQSHEDGTYTVTYIPLEAGRHTINLALKNRPIASPPYFSTVKSGIHASGAGVDKAEQFLPTKFTLAVKNLQESGMDLTPKDLQVSITPPTTSVLDPPQIHDDGHGNFEVVWTPLDVGRHVVLVNLKGQPIANSPFTTMAEKSSITASGPGLEKGEVLVPSNFTINTKPLKAHDVPVGVPDLQVQVTGPKGPIDHDVKDNLDGTFDVHYIPNEVGRYQINLGLKGRPIAQSPYNVPAEKSSIKVSGPGLEKGEQYIPAAFQISAKKLNETGVPLSKDDVKIDIQGPKGPIEPTIKDNEDGTFDVTYTPIDPGRHSVNVAVKNQPVGQFNVPVDKTSISAAAPQSGEQFIPFEFVVPTQVLQDAGIPVTTADFQVGVQGPKGPLDSKVKDNEDGTFSIDFHPLDVGKHAVTVNMRGQPIANSPLNIPIEKSSITASGAGLEKGEVLVPSQFVIGAQKLLASNVPISTSDLEVKVQGPRSPVEAKITDNGDGSFGVTYTPADVGKHQVSLAVKGRPIAASPYSVQVDKSSITAGGAGAEKGEQFIPALIALNTGHLAQKGSPLHPDDIKVQIQGPKGAIEPVIKDHGNGNFDIGYVPLDVGRHNVNIAVKGQPIANSPLNIPVEKSTITCDGPGLEKAEVLLPTHFNVHSQKLKESGVPLAPSDLEIVLNGPKGPVQAHVEPKEDGSFTVSYVPHDVGRHIVGVNVKGRPVGNSPYTLAIDKSTITAQGPGLVKGEQYIPTHFSILAKHLQEQNVGLKAEELQVVIQGPKGPLNPTIKDNEDGTFDVGYTPVDIGRHNVTITARGQAISGSPFAVPIEKSSIAADTPHSAEQFIPSTFLIPVKALKDAGVSVTPEDLKVQINGPKGLVDSQVSDHEGGSLGVSYLPLDVGRHSINVSLKGQPIANSPFNVPVEKSSITATGPGLEKGEVLVPSHFVIGAQKLLENKVPLSVSDLEVKINGPKGPVDPKIIDKGDGSFDVSYTPNDVGRHQILLGVKGRPIASSPYSVQIDKSAITAVGAGAEKAEQFIPAEFHIQAKHLHDSGNPLNQDDIKVQIQGPKGALEPTLKDHGDGAFSVFYTPLDVGKHTITTTVKGQPIANSPIGVMADKSSITAAGPGLEKAEVLVPTGFVVSALKLHEHNLPIELEITINGPKGPIQPNTHNNNDGTVQVSYLPSDVGRHQILVGMKGRPVAASPYSVVADKSSITVTPPQRAEQFVPTNLVLQTGVLAEKGVTPAPEDIKVAIQGPKGPVEATIQPKPDGTFDIAWTPLDIGKHNITASIKGQPLANSPIGVQVDKSTIGVNGKGLESGEVLVPANFTVDASVLNQNSVPLSPEDLEVKVNGPKGPVEQLTVTPKGDGIFDVTYVPTEVGRHQVAVDVKKRPVGSSPYNAQINKTTVTASGPGLEKGEQYIPTNFTIHAEVLHNAGVAPNENEFAISIAGPTGAVQPTIQSNQDGTFLVQYVPQEAGRHKVEVGLRGQAIVGSPWSVAIDKSVTDTGKSNAYGPGLQPGNLTDHSTHFTIQARNQIGDPMKTGGDPFKVAITGPHQSNPEPKIVDNNDGTYHVEYTPTCPGEHVIAVTLNGEHILDSPFQVPIERDPEGADPSQFYAFGPGVEANNPSNTNVQPVGFTIQAVNPKGEKIGHGGHLVEVEVFGPNGAELSHVHVTDNGDGTYAVSYEPVDPGHHQVDVVLKNITFPLYYDHIKDSPFQVQIQAGTDPSKSQVHGPGLHEAFDTLPATFHIQAKDRDGNNMPHGGDPFEVQVTGPSGPVPIQIKDNGDGTYDVTYEPTEHGPHDIDVNLRGKPVGGGPFHLDVKQGADHHHSQVETYSFIIRAKTKEGTNKIFGGDSFETTITTPGGVVLGEDVVKIKDIGDGTYVVYYTLPRVNEEDGEKGVYLISVKLNGHHIKGSPWKQVHGE